MKRAVLPALVLAGVALWSGCDSEPPTAPGSVAVAPMMAPVTPPATHYEMAYTEFPTGVASATDVFYLNTKAKVVRQLTSHPGRDQMPSWSPDGTRIVFSTTRYSGGGNDLTDLDLAVMEIAADGSPGTVTRITSSPGQETYPAWSPDGNKIAYVCEVSPWPGPRYPHLCYSEWTVAGGWSGPWLLTMDPPPFLPPNVAGLRFRDTHPTWSPDGNWVLFSRWCVLGPCGFTDRDLFMAPVIPAGNPVPPFPVRVTQTPGVNEDNPSWRPTPAGNGDIAYNAVTYSMRGPVEYTSEDIYSMTLATWPPSSPITTSGTQLTSTGDNDYPWWSPDGKEILFLSWRDAQWDLFRMLPNGMLERNLTGTPASDEGFGRIRPAITP